MPIEVDSIVSCPLCGEGSRVGELGAHLVGHTEAGAGDWRCHCAFRTPSAATLTAHCLLTGHDARRVRPPSIHQQLHATISDVQQKLSCLQSREEPGWDMRHTSGAGSELGHSHHSQTTATSDGTAETPPGRLLDGAYEACLSQEGYQANFNPAPDSAPFDNRRKQLIGRIGGEATFLPRKKRRRSKDFVTQGQTTFQSQPNPALESPLPRERGTNEDIIPIAQSAESVEPAQLGREPEKDFLAVEYLDPAEVSPSVALSNRQETCQKCGLTLKLNGTAEFVNHVTCMSHSQSSQKPWNCRKCSRSYFSTKDMSKHFRKEHHIMTPEEQRQFIETTLDAAKVLNDLKSSFPDLYAASPLNMEKRVRRYIIDFCAHVMP